MIKLVEYVFNEVDEFKYLGVMIAGSRKRDEDKR